MLQSLLASECDFTACSKLSAQLPLKQEGPALPSLLLSQNDTPAACATSSTLILPKANLIRYNSNNKFCNILAL